MVLLFYSTKLQKETLEFSYFCYTKAKYFRWKRKEAIQPANASFCRQ